LKKSHKTKDRVLSDSDYSYTSDKRKSKKKKTKKKTTKKNQNLKNTKKVQTPIPADNKNVISIRNSNKETTIEKVATTNEIERVVTVLPITVNNVNYMNMKRYLEENSTVEKKRLKNNDDSEPLVFNNTISNDCLLYKHSENIYTNSGLHLLKPLSTINLENKSSSSNGSYQFSSLGQNYVNSLPHTLSSTLNKIIQPTVPLMCFDNGQKYMQVEQQPTLEPIRIRPNKDDEIFEGMFMFVIFVFTMNL